MTHTITYKLKNKFKKIDEQHGIHLWEMRINPHFSVIDPATFEDVPVDELVFREAVCKTFSDICKENKIMCGKSFVSPKIIYFIRLYLDDAQNGHFLLKCSGQDVEVKVSGLEISKDLDVEVY